MLVLLLLSLESLETFAVECVSAGEDHEGTKLLVLIVRFTLGGGVDVIRVVVSDCESGNCEGIS
jgi:hypothetical protein